MSTKNRAFPAVCSRRMCTPGMGVNLWGESPLYMNPVNVNVFSTLTKVLAEGKGVSVRKGLKEARAESYEPTNRNSIQKAQSPGKSAPHDEAQGSGDRVNAAVV